MVNPWELARAFLLNWRITALQCCIGICCTKSVWVAPSCPTVCNPMDCSPPGSFVHWILQTRILQWVAMPFSRGSSLLRDGTQISWIGRLILYHWATREAPKTTWISHNYIYIYLSSPSCASSHPPSISLSRSSQSLARSFMSIFLNNFKFYFLAVLGPHCCEGFSLIWVSRDDSLVVVHRASHCGGFSCC